MYASLPDLAGPTTSTDAPLSYSELRLGEQVDRERHHLARADFGQ
jgi:hypothetical protein